jgi:RNA-directed DNA polymerase
MDAERQQGMWYQPSLLEWGENQMRHAASGDGGTEPAASEVSQAFTASDRQRALTGNLMEQICERSNLNRAYKRVKANKGAAGVDGMTVSELFGWLVEHKEELLTSLLDGTYQPQTVRGVAIPKRGGGKRQLGIPTVVDRLVRLGVSPPLVKLQGPCLSRST